MRRRSHATRLAPYLLALLLLSGEKLTAAPVSLPVPPTPQTPKPPPEGSSNTSHSLDELEELYVRGFVKIQQAFTYFDKGDPQQALVMARESLGNYQEIALFNPDWNKEIVHTRIEDSRSLIRFILSGVHSGNASGNTTPLFDFSSINLDLIKIRVENEELAEKAKDLKHALYRSQETLILIHFFAKANPQADYKPYLDCEASGLIYNPLPGRGVNGLLDLRPERGKDI